MDPILFLLDSKKHEDILFNSVLQAKSVFQVSYVLQLFSFFHDFCHLNIKH